MNTNFRTSVVLATIAMSNAIKLGSPGDDDLKNCDCLGYHGGHVKFNAEGESYFEADGTIFPGAYGTSCAAWDEDFLEPDCTGSERPQWCSSSWCYVPTQCTADDTTASGLFDGLAYSYQTCGSIGPDDSGDDMGGDDSGDDAMGDASGDDSGDDATGDDSGDDIYGDEMGGDDEDDDNVVETYHKTTVITGSGADQLTTVTTDTTTTTNNGDCTETIVVTRQVTEQMGFSDAIVEIENMEISNETRDIPDCSLGGACQCRDNNTVPPEWTPEHGHFITLMIDGTTQ